MMKQKDKAGSIYTILSALYPDTASPLTQKNHFELLVAVVLSAQSQDKQVNKVTPALFARWPDAAALAQASLADVENALRTLGLFRSKAKNIRALAALLVENHGGRVPNSFKDLIALPGVGQKTAQVVLFHAFGQPGLAVDTHVHRLANRMGLAPGTQTPEKTEPYLKALFDPQDWGGVSLRLIHHGRAVCDARKPNCAACQVAKLCDQNGVGLG